MNRHMLARTLFRPVSVWRMSRPSLRGRGSPGVPHIHQSLGTRKVLNTAYKMASDSSRVNDISNCSSEPHGQDAAPAPFEVVKVYPSRGPLTQYRLASATSFTCSCCQRQKKAKLIATRDSQWDALLCNGCYGFVLSKE
jgi:hypothetical protein